MPTKIVKEITDEEKLLSGAEVTPIQLKGLSDNFFNRVYVIDDDDPTHPRKMDSTGTWSEPKKNDTKTVYFSRQSIEELFQDNEPCDGLVIHLGVHDAKIYPHLLQPEYQNKLMVVLSTMLGKIPKIEIGDSVEIAEKVTGGGMDNGKLCPPDKTC